MLLQKFPLTFPSPSSFIKHNRNITSSFLFHEMKLKTSSRTSSNYYYSSSPLIICAVEKESEFELDKDKAREALEKLDQQLQSLSNKQGEGVVTQPRKKVIAPVVEYDREKQTMKEELPEFSDSYFAYSALALLAITILYNIFFITVIKPSVDGP